MGECGSRVGRDLEIFRKIGFEKYVVNRVMGMGFGERRKFFGIFWGWVCFKCWVDRDKRYSFIIKEFMVCGGKRYTGILYIL